MPQANVRIDPALIDPSRETRSKIAVNSDGLGAHNG
jgi:hypothetical protein